MLRVARLHDKVKSSYNSIGPACIPLPQATLPTSVFASSPVSPLGGTGQRQLGSPDCPGKRRRIASRTRSDPVPQAARTYYKHTSCFYHTCNLRRHRLRLSSLYVNGGLS